MREVDGVRTGHYSLLVGQASYDVYARDLGEAPDEEGARAFEVTVGARTYTLRLRDERARALERLAGGARHTGDAVIRAPTPGWSQRAGRRWAVGGARADGRRTGSDEDGK